MYVSLGAGEPGSWLSVSGRLMKVLCCRSDSAWAGCGALMVRTRGRGLLLLNGPLVAYVASVNATAGSSGIDEGMVYRFRLMRLMATTARMSTSPTAKATTTPTAMSTCVSVCVLTDALALVGETVPDATATCQRCSVVCIFVVVLVKEQQEKRKEKKEKKNK